jgi:gliding motility-associated lipoprotein GldH
MKLIQALMSSLLIAGMLSGCQRNSHYHHSEAPPAGGWEMNRTLFFQDSLRSDVPETVHMEIELRHNNLYPYQNIWIYLKTKCSDGTNRLDSINWKLAEPSGRWLGDGWGSLYSLSYSLPDLSIRKTTGARWFVIEIQHGLRDPLLPGIESVGVHLFTDR